MEPWVDAWIRAADTFYAQQWPTDHFATSPDQSNAVAQGLVRLLRDTVEYLQASGYTDPIEIWEVGGGDGELMTQVLELATAQHPEVVFSAHVIEQRPRPVHLPIAITWIHGSAPRDLPSSINGMIVAHEFLDDVPLAIAQYTQTGELRYVEVDALTGKEQLGDPVCDGDRTWIHQWWPRSINGERIEIGRTRDHIWSTMAATVSTGLAIAIDYAHTHDERVSGRFSGGTLRGYNRGYPCQPIPDGSMNITAHVALDSCASAAEQACAPRQLTTQFISQRDALRTLVQPRPRGNSPDEMLVALAEQSHVELARDSNSFGAFTWLIHRIEMGR